LAYQLLVVQGADVQNELVDTVWMDLPSEAKRLIESQYQVKRSALWAVYQTVTTGMNDPDLPDLQGTSGLEGYTDPECVDRILAAA
jgi:hypothetical protein